MAEHADVLARYKQLRRVGLELNNKLVRSLTKAELEQGGKKLGMWRRGTLVFDTEDMSSVLMDFCIHDVRHKGRNAIERYLAKSPSPAGSDEMISLQAKLAAWYSVFVVEATEPGVGIRVRDLLREEPMFVVDIGLSQTAEVGAILASRMMAPEGITMTTGAALPIGAASPAERARFVETIKSGFPGVDFRHMSPEQSSRLATTLIRLCLARGSAEYIQYADAGAPVDARRPSSTHRSVRSAGRNDPCPCGSGKKFKKCCGAKG
jgi:hypothetical protein